MVDIIAANIPSIILVANSQLNINKHSRQLNVILKRKIMHLRQKDDLEVFIEILTV